ncbi:MAG: cob(I)yrinic acid a,c-diamide adenosyltransferase [Propionibacteriaceae bacterium]|jgi:cob(I)alamin adenosyltransferase|nr:cob(I)yrinic acid a,c-diamide adenosyltransferase [Propionibacteriaceae bacterium]
MVKLTRIYTRTGDAGQTRLADMSAASKTDPRVQAYGSVDEANSILGVVVAQPELPDGVRGVLRQIQNELFDVGADLATPLAINPEYPPLRIEETAVVRLESWIDEYGKDLPALRSFALPGGTQAAAYAQLARAVVRRAERAAWQAAELYGSTEGDAASGGVSLTAIRYLNRLSDLLFVLGRHLAQEAGEILWVPAADREISGKSAVASRGRIQAQQGQLDK